jgi:hypothetical protein
MKCAYWLGYFRTRRRVHISSIREFVNIVVGDTRKNPTELFTFATATLCFASLSLNRRTWENKSYYAKRKATVFFCQRSKRWPTSGKVSFEKDRCFESAGRVYTRRLISFSSSSSRCRLQCIYRQEKEKKKKRAKEKPVDTVCIDLTTLLLSPRLSLFFMSNC